MRRFCLVLLVLACSVLTGADEAKDDKPTLVLDAGGHTANITSLFFSPDGKQLFSTSVDGTVRLWDVSSGDALRTLRLPVRPDDRAGPGSGSHCAALAPNGRLLAVAGRAPTGSAHWIFLYDLIDNKVVHVLKRHPRPIWKVAFSPDGKWLASACDDRIVRVWEVATGKMKHRLTWHTGPLRAVVFSPDGTLLASGGLDKTLRLWSVAGGSRKAAREDIGENITALAWSPDGKVLASTGGLRHVRLFGPDGASLGQIKRTGVGPGLAFSADGKLLQSAGTLIDMTQRKERVHFSSPIGITQAVALSADGKLAALGSTGPSLYLRETATGRILHQLGGRGRPIRELSWSPDGKTVGWKQVRYAGEKTFPTGTFQFTELKYGPPPGKDFVAARHSLGELSLEPVEGRGHRLTVKRGAETVRELQTPGGIGGITCYTFLDAKRVVIGQITGLFLYDATTGERLRTYQKSGGLRSVAAAPGKDYFVAAGIDEVIRLYTADRDLPLLSLYVAGNEWVAWTPEGYYAASPGGEHLMGWHVSSDPQQLPAFHAAAQFHKSLYRPGAIRRLLETRDIARALTLADRESGRPSEMTEVEQVLPPTVAIVSPTGASLRVHEPKLAVKAVARSVGKHPVAELQLLLDGRPYEGRRGLRSIPKPEMGAVTKEWTVELTPGPHRLSVVARSAVSSATSNAIEVLFEPDKPPDPKDLRPSLYVLCVGINAYPGDLALQYAVRDAGELRDVLAERSKALFREVKTELLVDREATRAGILAKLDWLKTKMKPHDVAVISYAGHGHRDDKGRFYLLSCDMDPDNLDKTTVTGEELKKYLAELPGRVLLLLDACHSGAIGGRGKGSSSITDDLARDLADDDCGVIVMCAAMGKEESQESPEFKHGLFTQAIIEGLSGGADYNKDGLIQLTELDLYVDNRVAQLSKDEQHPVTAKPTTVRSFALTKR